MAACVIAYFVGRKEIIEWINQTCELSLSKIEETASGAVSCLLLDIMYPGQVPLHRVNWAAKQSFEYVSNYKILQTAFTKLKIDRHIDVDRLISGRAMDNLEFMQWFKRYFELQIGERGAEYDPSVARSRGKGGSSYSGAKGASSGGGAQAPARSNTAPAAESRRTGNVAGGSKENKGSEANKDGKGGPAGRAAGGRKASSTAGPSSAEAMALKKKNADMKLEMDGLEKERDFYFNKLRDIEIMLQDLEDSGKGTELTAEIFKVLYATADGFVQSPSAASVASQHMNSPPRGSAAKSVAPAAVAGSGGKANLFSDSKAEAEDVPPPIIDPILDDEEGDDDDDMLSPGAPANNPFTLSGTPQDV